MFGHTKCPRFETAAAPPDLTITDQRLSSCGRDVRCVTLPLQRNGALRDAGDHGRCVHDGPPFRDCLLRDAVLLRDDGAPRAHDARPPCDDALPLVWTCAAPFFPFGDTAWRTEAT